MSAADERFWRKVTKTDTCWLWTGAQNSKGYGCVGINRRVHLTHRVAYTWLVGPIPEGLTIDHLCRNKVCVRPDHLEPVTVGENIRRAHERIRTCEHGFAHVYRKGSLYGPECADCRSEREAWSATPGRIFRDLSLRQTA
jgi:hypothetical protein